MKVTFLAAVMITVLLLSVSSVYLNKIVFADDKWSDIAKRQQEQNARAAVVYDSKYQFNNMDQSVRNWSPLASTTTDENSKGRDIAGKSQMSLENAMAAFDKVHAMQLVSTQNTGYAGLTSVTTDEKARDRNAIITQARDQTDQQVAALVSQLAQIDQSYATMQPVTSTDEKGYNRQALILQTSSNQEAQAAALLNQIWQIDQAYVNIKPAGATNEQTLGRQLTPLQAQALQNGIMVFEEIHAKRLAATYSTGYAGLTSTTTNEQIVGPGWWAPSDRTTQIDTATGMALQNAINFYNAYYPNTPLSQPNYSH